MVASVLDILAETAEGTATRAEEREEQAECEEGEGRGWCFHGHGGMVGLAGVVKGGVGFEAGIAPLIPAVRGPVGGVAAGDQGMMVGGAAVKVQRHIRGRAEEAGGDAI